LSTLINETKTFWAIVPAAGIGARMQADRPKQYLPLQDKTVIEHTLDRLLSVASVKGVVLSIGKTDEYWPSLNYQSHKPVIESEGGAERSDSVLYALLKLQQTLTSSGEDLSSVWVLVHDAARPCVRVDDIEKLIGEASKAQEGGLLALPVRDTMKRSTPENQVEHTVERKDLWHALTPQMFRLTLLLEALQNAQRKKLAITDDASAMELAGYHPKLIEAHEDNIKITRAFDLRLAELYLLNQE